ncbi:MAG: hypothetical protein EZS28_018378 [Streblomastix strix]|uniref:Uncharacterized protein n=1 Tax=Streblomastix strix TaxID=222440 RepID=A0A5J4VU35_9EUKA|nr:MAG: hypothetical protein EZS28_018378 [Streblomastix strix]
MNPISLIQSDSNAQTNQNIDYNYINSQHNIPHMSISPRPQQQSPTLEETEAIRRTISSGDPQGYKRRESESKQAKLQQQTGLIEEVEKFHEIMKPTIEEEMKMSKVMLPEQYKDCRIKMVLLSYILQITITRHQQSDLKIQFSKKNNGNCLTGTCAKAQSPLLYLKQLQAYLYSQQNKSQNNQMKKAKNHEQLTNEQEKIVADGTDDNGDDDQSEHAIKPKLFINGND